MIKIFIKKVILFTFPVIVFFLIGIFLPTTPRASKSLLMAEQNKKALLKNTNSPRIIFVGGSNLSFGLNSKNPMYPNFYMLVLMLLFLFEIMLFDICLLHLQTMKE